MAPSVASYSHFANSFDCKICMKWPLDDALLCSFFFFAPEVWQHLSAKKTSFGAEVGTRNPKLQLASQWSWFWSRDYLLWSFPEFGALMAPWASAFAYNKYIYYYVMSIILRPIFGNCPPQKVRQNYEVQKISFCRGNKTSEKSQRNSQSIKDGPQVNKDWANNLNIEW